MSRIQEVIYELRGSSNTIDLDDFTVEELEELDEAIFECSRCGWWCDIEEEVGNSTQLVCKECKKE